jgi:hypothetical protein
MDRLAAKVVAFERDLVRAGADPEYLFNPHYAYNPYPTSKVDRRSRSSISGRTFRPTHPGHSRPTSRSRIRHTSRPYPRLSTTHLTTSWRDTLSRGSR